MNSKKVNKKRKKNGDANGVRGTVIVEPIKTIPVFESIECVSEVTANSGLPGCLFEDDMSEESNDEDALTNVRNLRFMTGGEGGRLRFWKGDSNKPFYETDNDMLGPSGSEAISTMFTIENSIEKVDKQFSGILCVMGDSRIISLSPSKDDEVVLQYQLIGNHDELVDLCYIWHHNQQSEPFVALATNSNDIYIYDSDIIEFV